MPGLSFSKMIGCENKREIRPSNIKQFLSLVSIRVVTLVVTTTVLL